MRFDHKIEVITGAGKGIRGGGRGGYTDYPSLPLGPTTIPVLDVTPHSREL